MSMSGTRVHVYILHVPYFALPSAPRAVYVYSIGAGRVVARAAFPLSPSAPSSAAATATSSDAYTYGARADGRGAEGRDEEGGVGGGGGREIGTPCAFEAAEKVMVVVSRSLHYDALAAGARRPRPPLPAAALAVPHPPSSPASDANRASFPPYASPGNSPPYASSSSPNGAHSLPVSGSQFPTPHIHTIPPPTPTSALHGRPLAFLTLPPAAPSSAPGAAPLASWHRTLGSHPRRVRLLRASSPVRDA
ncbi:hypothetical protein B0H19DRAFT_1152646 [Mycena capillaripes]|nr:hypothetical protein B0H19DRAFT_1152646 [Mycena capillaripes]